MFFICVHSAREHIALNARIGLHNPFTGDKGRLADHILSGCVAGGEVKTQVAHPRCGVLFNIAQLARRGGGLRLRGNLIKILFNPDTKFASFAGIIKNKHRCPLHGVIDHSDLNTARFPQQSCTAVIAGNQGAFAGGHGHIELSLGMFTVDQ